MLCPYSEIAFDSKPLLKSGFLDTIFDLEITKYRRIKHKTEPRDVSTWYKYFIFPIAVYTTQESNFNTGTVYVAKKKT